jgi:hypothetical protein
MHNPVRMYGQHSIQQKCQTGKQRSSSTFHRLLPLDLVESPLECCFYLPFGEGAEIIVGGCNILHTKLIPCKREQK